MGSTLFEVEVVQISDSQITLNLVVAHPDAGPPRADKVFALRLLYENAFDMDLSTGDFVGICPLGEAVTYDECMSESWAHENASRFIESVSVEPIGLPELPVVGTKANYSIVVTDPKWLEHLKNGQNWRSAAYS